MSSTIHNVVILRGEEQLEMVYNVKKEETLIKILIDDKMNIYLMNFKILLT